MKPTGGCDVVRSQEWSEAIPPGRSRAADIVKRVAAKTFAGLNVDAALNGILENWVYRNRSADFDSAGSRRARRFQILAFHKVSPDNHPFFAPVSPADFERQLAFLKRFYCVLPLRELVDRSAKRDLPPRAVALTFDDGYRDNYEHAFPLLKKYSLNATIFLATGVIGNDSVLWHDRVFDAFRFTTKSRARLSAFPDAELQLNTASAKQGALGTVLAHAKRSTPEERRLLVDELECELAPDIAPGRRTRMLSWEQVREMRGMGIDFGSHTVTHSIVSRIDEEGIRSELAESKREIEKQVGTPVTLFAYPNGSRADFDDRAKIVLKELGYRAAVTTIRGFNTSSEDPFELRRDQPWQREIALFRMSFFLQRHGLTQ